MPQGYLIKLMKDGKALAHRQVDADTQELDLSALLPAEDDGHDYTATVQALGDGTRWRDSLPSEASEAFVPDSEPEPDPDVVVVFDVVGTDQWTIPENVTSVKVLVVAGGGAGGGGSQYRTGGGGGGGGLLYEEEYIFDPAELAAGEISVTVGAGGNESNGGNSIFGNLTAIGGGMGVRDAAGANGGSGGGGAGNNGPLAGGSGEAGPPRQGHDGGTGCASGTPWRAGGGGGAGAAGADGIDSGNGGVGLYFGDIFGDEYGDDGWFAGGGGGGSGTIVLGQGGKGGGGVGGLGKQNGDPGTDGLPNTGGGGGGAGSNGGYAGTVPYSLGGSGVVIVTYEL